MANIPINILIAFGISVLLTGILIPQILLIAFRKNLFDTPDERKIHTALVPRLGGLAFLPSIFFSITCVYGINIMGENISVDILSAESILQICFISCAMLLVFLVGLADDLVGVRYNAKFVIQIISASFLIVGGLQIDNLHGLFFLYNMPHIAGVLLTVLVIVFILNSINLIDGIDGLASGLSAIALFFYGIAFFINGEHFYSILSTATLGTLISFFYYNVFGKQENKKKIFMGDTGALTIGVILSTLSIKMNGMETPLNEYHVNPFVAAFSPLIVPCFDVIRVYLYRITKHRNPFLPDKNHIHHKILALGVPQHLAMISIIIISAIFITTNILLSPFVNITIIFILDSLIYILGNIVLSNAIKKRREHLNIQDRI